MITLRWCRLSDSASHTARNPAHHASSVSASVDDDHCSSTGPAAATEPPICNSPEPRAKLHGRCRVGTSAAVRTRSGTGTPTAVPAAATSARRTTRPAVTGRPGRPTHRASSQACSAIRQPRARRAAPAASTGAFTGRGCESTPRTLAASRRPAEAGDPNEGREPEYRWSQGPRRSLFGLPASITVAMRRLASAGSKRAGSKSAPCSRPGHRRKLWRSGWCGSASASSRSW